MTESNAPREDSAQLVASSRGPESLAGVDVMTPGQGRIFFFCFFFSDGAVGMFVHGLQRVAGRKWGDQTCASEYLDLCG